MPFPDALPSEIWYIIVEVGGLSPLDLRAMLAVAPQTTARHMHDAAFSLFFKILHIRSCREPKFTTNLSWYLHPDSWRLRAAEHNLRIEIEQDDWIYIEALPRTSLRVENRICNAITILPNITTLHWFDGDPSASRRERRWDCIRPHLQQLTGLTLHGFKFNSPLDLQTAKGLRYLSLKNCLSSTLNDGPRILSDAKIQTLLVKDAKDPGYYPELLQHILSGLNLSSLSDFILKTPSLSQKDPSYPSHRSFSIDSLGIGPNLETLFLSRVDYQLALELCNTCSFTSLRSCSLRCSGNRTSHNTHTLVRPLSFFLSRQTSLELLAFEVYEFGFLREDEQSLEEYDAALCSEDFVNTLLRLKKLKYLKLVGYTFTLDHPVLHIGPLSALEALIVVTMRSTPLNSRLADIVTKKLRLHTALRLFVLDIHSCTSYDIWPSTFAQALRKIAPQMEFTEVNHCLYWLQNGDSQPQSLSREHPMNRKYVDSLMTYKELLSYSTKRRTGYNNHYY